MSAPISLKELLAKATAGPWRIGPYGGVYPVHISGPCIIAADHRDGTRRTNGDNNEALIARCSPDVMTAVLTCLESWRDALTAAERWHSTQGDPRSMVSASKQLHEVNRALALLNGLA